MRFCLFGLFCFHAQWALWDLQIFQCYGLFDPWILTNIDQPGFT